MDRRRFISLTVGAAAVASFRPAFAFAGPYGPDNPLFLDQNENSLGMSESAREAAREALAYGNRYPGEFIAALRGKLAGYLDISTAQLTMANGSTGIIQAVINAMAEDDVVVIAPQTTYGEARSHAAGIGTGFRAIHMSEGITIDLPAMEAASLAVDGNVIVYLVSPNNPTGLLASSVDIHTWIRRAPDNVFFIMDEAYHEYVADPDYESTLDLVKAGYRNLVVARTFSKIYAMAGMRLGYGVAHASVIRELQSAYPAWSLNVPALMAASASLDDSAFVEQSLSSNARSKVMLYGVLDELGLEYLPSETNFVLHRIGMDLSAYQRAMRNRHVYVGRDFGLGRWNRLSLGTPEEMDYFLGELRAVHG